MTTLDPEVLEQALERLRQNPRGYNPLRDEAIPEDQRALLVPYIEQARRLLLTPRPRPSAQAMQEARARMHRALEQQRRRAFGGFFIWLNTLTHRSLSTLGAALATVVLIVAVGIGGYALTMSSLPGQPLYTVKRSIERAALGVAPPQQEALMHARLSVRRLNEFAALAERGVYRMDLITAYLDELRAARQSFDTLPPTARDATRATMLDTLTQAENTLALWVERVPPQYQPIVSQAYGETRQMRAALQGQQVSPTATPTPTSGPSLSPTPTSTPTIPVATGPTTTPTWTPSATSTPSPTATWTPSVTPSATWTPSATPTFTATPTPQPTLPPTPTAAMPARELSPTPTPMPTRAPTPTPTWTLSPTFTPTWTPRPTRTPTPTATHTPTWTPLPTPTPTPTWTPLPTPTPTWTPVPTPTPTWTPLPTATPTPTWTWTSPLPTPTPTHMMPTHTPRPTPTHGPRWTPTPTPTPEPTETEEPEPTETREHHKTKTPEPTETEEPEPTKTKHASRER